MKLSIKIRAWLHNLWKKIEKWFVLEVHPDSDIDNGTTYIEAASKNSVYYNVDLVMNNKSDDVELFTCDQVIYGKIPEMGTFNSWLIASGEVRNDTISVSASTNVLHFTVSASNGEDVNIEYDSKGCMPREELTVYLTFENGKLKIKKK